MSRIQVQSYLSRIEQLRRVSGASNEVIVSQAFARLLEDWATDQKLIFVQQHAYETSQKTLVRPDGVVLHDIRVPLGWWEAKDTADDLDKEIEKKLRKGYPQDNIVFENGETAVLYQNRAEVTRCDMTDPAALEKLVTLFFGYERPEIAEFRGAVRQFGTDLPAILEGLRGKISEAYQGNSAFAAQAATFLTHAKQTINPGLTEDDVREMLIQHILTEEIFTQVFNDGQYHRENNIARELTRLEDAFFTGGVKRDALRAMQPYYAAIKANAAQITAHSEKQTFLKLIYEQFYKVYNPKAADRLGVVYTPNEIVRFMIEGADWLCEKHFGKTLIEPGVEILDPATGTGTFICELIEHFRGQPKALARKYKEELHANEVAILPYYVANLNIEATYAAVAGQYAEFPNLCFVDTLDNVAGLGIRAGHQGELFGAMSDENVERVKRQNSRKISVVIGNPPYNPRQEYYDQGNANRRYKRIDQTMKDTYIRLGKAQNKNSVYDMYTRFLRWATDRVHDDGIIAFITNRNFIEKAAFDGVRRSLAEEFHEVWLVDLGGDVRANPKLSGTLHNVFSIQTGVAIYFLVKKRKSKAGLIRYARRPEFETAQDKLAFLSSTPLSRTQFESITPSKTGDWIDAVSSDWSEFLPLCSKDQKAGHTRADGTIFKLFSLGNASHRDEWVYDISRENLEVKVQFFINAYEESRKDPNSAAKGTIRWDADLERYANSKVAKVFDPALIRRAQFRPFASRYLYFDQNLNARTYQLSTMFPTGGENRVISVSSVGFRSGYCVFSSDGPVDLHFGAAADGYQIVSRYRYTPTGERLDNITDWALKTFTDRYGKTAGVSRDTIFAYVYAALHDPVWRETYAINLKREFPRIPLHPEFSRWAGWGQRLLDLHIGYETVEPWPVARRDVEDVKAKAAGVSPKVILKSDPGAGVVTLDSETVLSGIPARAWDYRLGNRSAIDWVLDQHKEKVPKDPTIRAKFDTYRFADHKERVADLVARVVRVSVETLEIVDEIRAARR